MGRDEILLHPQKGLNPRITVCVDCRKEVGVALLGANDKVFVCRPHGQYVVGGLSPGQRTPCGCTSRDLVFERILEEHAKLPMERCAECVEKREAQKKMVEEGGILFQCVDCGCEGAIRPGHPMAVAVRKQLGVPAPKPCGVEFSKATGCPQCGQEVAPDGKQD